MSQPRTSSDVQLTTSPTVQAAPTGSPSPTSPSPASTPAPPLPTHTPSSVPVIAGSLVGVIVLVVCVVILLLLAKRRQRKRSMRNLRAASYDPMHFSQDPSDKRNGPNGYKAQAQPTAQDSACSSGSSAPPPPTHPGHQQTPPPLDQSSRSYSTHVSQRRPHHNSQDSQSYQPVPSDQIPVQRAGQSSSSSVPPRSPVLSHSQARSENMPAKHPHSQVNPSQMIPASPVPHGHAADAGVDVAVDNNNNWRTSSERPGRPGSGVPAIVVTRDVEDRQVQKEREGFGPGKTSDRGARRKPPPFTANGVSSGNVNEEERSGIPETAGDYGHAQGYTQGGGEDYNDRRQQQGMASSRTPASNSEYYSYPPPSLASGNIDAGRPSSNSRRVADTDRVGLAPDYAGQDSYPRPRTASASTTSGSSLPSSLSLPGVPPSPTASSIASSTRKSIGHHTQQQLLQNTERNPNAVTSNMLLTPSVSPFARQRQLRTYAPAPIPLSQLRNGASALEEEEDAPPAYETVWNPLREQHEQTRTETGVTEQGHPDARR